MKQRKENRVALLLHWAGGQKVWLFLAILLAMCGWGFVSLSRISGFTG